MSWSTQLRVGDYMITCTSNDNGDGGVVIPPVADFNDAEYLDALRTAKSLYPILANAMFVREMRDYWYQSHYSKQHVDRVKTLNAAWEYRVQEELITPEWLDDFIQDLRDDTPVFVEQPRTTSSVPRKTKAGFVYLLQQINGTHYKIGYTKNPESRSRTFGVQLPFEVEFICLIKSDDMIALEMELHQKFAQKRVNGEWFALDAEDIEYIKGLAK